MQSWGAGNQPLSQNDVRMEDNMSEMEMNDDFEIEDFTDELSDEALDREPDGRACCGGTCFPTCGH
jgi:hypothetical protein